MRHYLVVLILLVLAFGCIGLPQVPGNLTNDTIKDTFSTNTIKSEQELKSQFNCEFGVENLTKVNNLVVWTCLRDYSKFEDSDIGIYWIDAHPMGSWIATYILYDGKEYKEIKKPDELKLYFVPLKTKEEALVYTYLHEGLNYRTDVPQNASAGKSGSEIQGDNYIVTIIHEDWAMCPCYGGFMKSVYNVTPQAEITKINWDSVYSYQEDCIC